jgi:hypothetical protein
MASSLDFVSFSLSNSSNRFRISCFLFLCYVCLFACHPLKCCLVLLRHPCEGQLYVREDERDYELYRLCVRVKLPQRSSGQPNVLYVHLESPHGSPSSAAHLNFYWASSPDTTGRQRKRKPIILIWLIF